MRVAWQAGVIRALAEAGLTFDHVDGTSGGIMNAAMLLSGISPDDMGERWSTLDVKGFGSPLPLAEYVKGPTNLVALGDADGVRRHVFPHLGIDVARIRASGSPEGTFNVCNFTDKTCDAIAHTDVDEDLLVAGISLPIVMPAVVKGDRTYTDAVWIKDANLLEAVHRGAQELWLVWCIGNTSYYGDGPLEQYVAMIEMSANGALFAELDHIRDMGRFIRLHVVKPEYPLPLDPEYFLGRISGSTLVAMGYRDARRYLSSMTNAGVPLDRDVTRMKTARLGVRFTERAEGHDTELEVCVEVRDIEAFAANPSAGTDMVGWLRRNGRRVPLAGGRFSIHPSGEVRYEADDVVAVKTLHDDPGFDLWSDFTTIELRLPGESPVELRLGLGDVRQLVTSLEPMGAHGIADRGRAVTGLGRLLLRELWDRFL
jgi:NTE family protein